MSELLFRVNTEHKSNQPEPCFLSLFTNHPDHSTVEHVAFLVAYLSLCVTAPLFPEKCNFPRNWSVDHCGPLTFLSTFLLVVADKGMRYRGNRY